MLTEEQSFGMNSVLWFTRFKRFLLPHNTPWDDLGKMFLGLLNCLHIPDEMTMRGHWSYCLVVENRLMNIGKSFFLATLSCCWSDTHCVNTHLSKSLHVATFFHASNLLNSLRLLIILRMWRKCYSQQVIVKCLAKVDLKVQVFV